MIIVFKPHSPAEAVTDIERKVIDFGYEPRTIRGVEHTVIAAVGDEISHKSLETLRGLPWIDQVIPIQKRFKLASREFRGANSVVEIGGAKIGGGNFMTIMGPCSVESRAQMRQTTRDLVDAGVQVVRGGAYKPRTSPYDFQGLGEEALDILAEMKAEFGVAVVTEILAVPHLAKLAEVADVLQIGARNCQNYHLLEVAADAGRPIILKRGMATTIEEWLLAAEYLIVHGCRDVILCERGIRTYEKATRFTLDVGAVAVAKKESHLPVIVDPSHPAGLADLVLPLAKAGIGVGADGLMVEVHLNPPEALSDAAQQLPSNQAGDFLAAIQPLVEVCAPANRPD